MELLGSVMDKYQITVNTFNKFAVQYQDKYMDFDLYLDTYDTFCELVTTPQAKVFEIGCGPGNITKYLLNKRSDFQVHGIDLAPNMVTLAKHNNPEATFEVMDGRHIGSITDKYDAVMCGFCAPYLAQEDMIELFANIRSILNTQGILYLSAMEDSEDCSGFQTSPDGDQIYIHYHQFDDIKPILEQSGFEILKLQRKDFPALDGTTTTDMFIYAKAT